MIRRPIKDLDYTEFVSVEEFEKKWDHGMVGPLKIGGEQPILLNWENRNKESTVVFFSPASSKVKQVPYWVGNNLSKTLDANILKVSDPSLVQFGDLNLGWYSGNSVNPEVMRELDLVLGKVLSGYKPILFGPSGGGWAALCYGSQIDGATIIAVNPQTDQQNYGYFPKYLEIAWAQKDVSDLPYSPDVTNRFESSQNCNIVYIQNKGDIHHYREHFLPFAASLPLGINFLALTPELGIGHVAPDSASVSALLNAAIKEDGWQELSSKCKEIEIKSSGVDKEDKSDHGNLKKGQIVADASIDVPMCFVDCAVSIQSEIDLSHKDYVILYDFGDVKKVESPDLSWSKGLKSYFQYTKAGAAGTLISQQTFRVPKGINRIGVKLAIWDQSRPSDKVAMKISITTEMVNK